MIIILIIFLGGSLNFNECDYSILTYHLHVRRVLLLKFRIPFFLEIDFYTLNIGALCASTTSVIIYQSTQSNVQEELML